MAIDDSEILPLALIFKCVDEYECRNQDPYEDGQTAWSNINSQVDDYSDDDKHMIPSDTSTYSIYCEAFDSATEYAYEDIVCDDNTYMNV